MKANIQYIRPGKELTTYREDFVSEDEHCLVTFKTLPPEISLHLGAALQGQGLIHGGQQVHTIKKVYYFHEPFNLLEFRSPEGELLGHYSDIGTPLERLGDGDYVMLDLFLDIWLYPNGLLVELDWDEFEDAIQRELITPAQAELARQTMQRLVAEAKDGIYPGKYSR